MSRAWLRRLTPLLVLLVLGGAGWLLFVELRGYRYADIRHGLTSIPRPRIAAALLLTGLSYWIMTAYDALALRYLQHPLPYRRTALASFLGYAFAHNLGLSILGGAAPRFRLYSAWQLSPAQITTLIGFTSITLWVGICAVGGLALVLDAPGLAAAVRASPALLRVAGIAMLGAAAAYLAITLSWRRRPFSVRGWTLPPPAPSIPLAQLGVAIADWTVASAVLYVLLPAGAISFPHLVGLFVLAQVTGLASHIPGGLGVFDVVILVALARRAPAPAVVGSLLAYRGVYYLLPLAIATFLIAAFEVRQRREGLARTTAILGRLLPEIAPRVLALATFATGALLLFSGVTPRHTGRLDWLGDILPLPVLEASHFLASLVGLGLILLASALQRRLDAAYHITVVLLAGGAALALLKGLDYEESLVLLGLLAMLLPCRKEFHRHTSLIGERFTVGWALAVLVVLGAAAALGMFAHEHTEYSRDLWWEFSLFGDAPRFLRASVGVGAAALIFAALHLLRPARPRTAPADAESGQTIRAIVAAAPVAAAHLALLGDKTFLFSDDRRAFVMYAVSGRACVAMGDPVGPPASAAELVWDFCELCDQHGTWPVFYEASAAALPLYLDAGLTPLKFGEEGRVRLETFSLDGSARKQQRYIVRAVERDGGAFAVHPAADVPQLLPELRAISDTWLGEKHTREKGFSLGRFDPAYLAELPVAVVRWQGRIVAFANLWCAGAHEEVAPDLMRYVRAAPPSVMEYLFLRLILWAKEQGYRWLNLGMVPLAGLEARAAAPFWNRVGALAFRYGEHFYNFQGLRQFKSKFDPEWRPKYLVSPGGLLVPRVLANVAALVSGGVRGVVAK